LSRAGVVNNERDCQTIAMRIGEFEINEPVPELKDPHMLAVLRPWIDVGSVGTLSLSRLERYLRAKELGRLARPGLFYDFTRYRPRSFFNEGRREFSVPNTIIRYAAREEGPSLIMVHLLEPHLYGEDFTDSMLEVLKFFGVKRYSLVGGMYDMVPHTRPLLVSGVSNGPNVEEENRMVRIRSSNYEGPTTITQLITQEAIKLGVETRIFVVHLPQYFQVDEDFTGTARLMEILCTLYRFPERLIELQRGREQYASLQDMINDTSGMASLLQRLEERYDREQQEQEPPPPPLSPQIEEFLKDLDEGFSPPS
jgi:PAC2 family